MFRWRGSALATFLGTILIIASVFYSTLLIFTSFIVWHAGGFFVAAGIVGTAYYFNKARKHQNKFDDRKFVQRSDPDVEAKKYRFR